MPINRDERTRLSTLGRKLVAGLITNDEFAYEAGLIGIDSNDPVVEEMFWNFDGLYGDLRTYKLRGRERLSDDVRQRIAKCILLLQSDETDFGSAPAAPRYPYHLGHFAVSLLALGASFILAATALPLGLVGAGVIIVLWICCLDICKTKWLQRQTTVWPEEWPFVDETSYRRALLAPRFLSGRGSVASV